MSRSTNQVVELARRPVAEFTHLKHSIAENMVFSADGAALYTMPLSEMKRIRAEISARPLLPYDQLDIQPMIRGSSSLRKLESLLTNGWERDGKRLPSLKPPLPWDQMGRSFSFHLHAFEPISLLNSGFDVYQDPRYLTLAREILTSWLHEHQIPLMSRDIVADIERALAQQGTMAWYDMSVGQRIYRLAYLIDVAAREPESECSSEMFSLLVRSLIFHQELLSRDSFFISHNNHGFYQAIGQLAASRRFRFLSGFEDYFRKASTRLSLMLDRSFFPSGPHMEHSPAYHYMVLGSCLGARRSGLIEDPRIQSTLAAAEHALGWMVQPDGSLVPFGDSDPKRRYRSPEETEQFSDFGLKVLMTGGAIAGEVPTGLKIYNEAGYVFGRWLPNSPTLDLKRASYFAQLAAFHSRTHKHADHLSLVWMEGGKNILIDPGRYGYSGKTVIGDELSNQGFFYSDPKRIYIEKTRAHNCVEIDSQDYPRKRAKPFGSALSYAGEQGALAVTCCEVRHKSIRHFRIVIVSPGSFLLTVDWLKDGKDERHDFRQWFQLASEWEAKFDEDILKAVHREKPDFQLCAASLLSGPKPDEIQVGRTEPEMAGWYSDAAYSLVPCSSTNWHLKQKSCAHFATLFVLSNTLIVDHEYSSLSSSMTSGKFRWVDEHRANTISFSRSTKDNSVMITTQ